MSLGRLKMKSSLIRRSKTRPAERDQSAKPCNGEAEECQNVWREGNGVDRIPDSSGDAPGSVGGASVGPVPSAQPWKSRKSVGSSIMKSIRRRLPWNRHLVQRGASDGATGGSSFNHESRFESRSSRTVCLVDSPPPQPAARREVDTAPGSVLDHDSDSTICQPPESIDLCATASNPAGADDDAAGHAESCYSNLEAIQTASLTAKLRQLPQYGWYWGPITRAEAEEKLADQPDGAFLVRDSSDHLYLLSLSFRSFGKTLHTRIEHRNGVFSFYAQSPAEGHPSIVELVEHSMTYSQSGVFCYSRARGSGAPSYPVRLTRPVSRFTRVRTLQYLCRFVIRQHTSVDAIAELPLPKPIQGFVEEAYY